MVYRIIVLFSTSHTHTLSFHTLKQGEVSLAIFNLMSYHPIIYI